MTQPVLFNVAGFVDSGLGEYPRFVTPIYRIADDRGADPKVHLAHVDADGKILHFEKFDPAIIADETYIKNDFGNKMFFRHGSFRSYAALVDKGCVFAGNGWENFCRGILSDHAEIIARLNPLLGLEFAEVAGDEAVRQNFAIVSAMALGEIDYKLTRRWNSGRGFPPEMKKVIDDCIDSLEAGIPIEIAGNHAVLEGAATVRVATFGLAEPGIRPGLHALKGMRFSVTRFQRSYLTDPGYWQNVDIAVGESTSFLNGEIEQLKQHSSHVTLVARVPGVVDEYAREGWRRYGADYVVSDLPERNVSELCEVALQTAGRRLAVAA
jgi:hypothetical protein